MEQAVVGAARDLMSQSRSGERTVDGVYKQMMNLLHGGGLMQVRQL